MPLMVLAVIGVVSSFVWAFNRLDTQRDAARAEATYQTALATEEAWRADTVEHADRIRRVVELLASRRNDAALALLEQTPESQQSAEFHLLRARCQHFFRPLDHSDAIGNEHAGVGIQLSRDGRRLLTVANKDFSGVTRLVRVWDTKTGQLVSSLPDWTRPGVQTVALSPAGDRVVYLMSNSNGVEGHIYDATTGAFQTLFPVRAGAQTSLDWSRDVIFSPNGSQIIVLDHHSRGSAFEICARYPAGTDFGEARSGVGYPFFTPDGRALLVRGRVDFEPSKYRGLQQIWGHMGFLAKHVETDAERVTVNDVCFNPAGSRMVVADDSTAHILDAATGKELHTIDLCPVPFAPVPTRRLRLTAGGTLVAIQGGTIRTWNSDTGQPLDVGRVALKYGEQLDLTEDGTRVVGLGFVCGYDGRPRFPLPRRGGYGVFSDDGVVRVLSEKGRVAIAYLPDVPDGPGYAEVAAEYERWKQTEWPRPGTELSGQPRDGDSVSTPDGRFQVTIRVPERMSPRLDVTFDGKRCEPVAFKVPGTSGLLWRLALSPTAPVVAFVISAGQSHPHEHERKKVLVYDVEKKRQLYEVDYDLQDRLLFTPDGNHLLVGATVHSLKTRRPVRAGEGLGIPELDSAIFTPDGKRLVARSTDGTIRFWDSTTLTPLFSATPK